MASNARRDAAGRPIIDRALASFVGELVSANPELLGHIDADRILFVAAGARRESRASIRPLTFGGSPPRMTHEEWCKPVIAIKGVRMLYEVALRPKFFLETTPAGRMRTIAHELWHIAPQFDGSLSEERRHHQVGEAELETRAAEIVERLDSSSDDAALFAFEGEVRISAWLARPPTRLPTDMNLRTQYDESDLYQAIREQRA